MVYTVAATMPKLTCSAQHGSTKHKQWQTPGVTLEHSMHGVANSAGLCHGACRARLTCSAQALRPGWHAMGASLSVSQFSS